MAEIKIEHCILGRKSLMLSFAPHSDAGANREHWAGCAYQADIQ